MLKIRFMEERDRSEVFSMMREFHSSDAVIYTASDEILHRDISDCIGDMPFIEGFVFEDAGEILGYSMVAKSYTTEFGGLCVWIEDLYIKEEFRGKGIGGEFFDFIEKRYEDKAVRYKLEVEEENVRAVSMYKKTGYDELGYRIMSKEMM